MGKKQQETAAAAVPHNPEGLPLGELPEFRRADRPAAVDGLAAAIQRIEDLEANLQSLREYTGRLGTKVGAMLFDGEGT
jgi:hypothetical protein